MKQLSNTVLSLAWRGPNSHPTDVCHWADGYPLNLHLYVELLTSVFDIKDETCVLDEVDELVELMKKTWSTLGINRAIHNVCFTWVLFEQYILTGQTEPDLLNATLTMLVEVESDAKKLGEREGDYAKTLASVLSSIIEWSEKKLLDYHQTFLGKSSASFMENVLALVLHARKILDEGISLTIVGKQELVEDDNHVVHHLCDNRVEFYIRSSLRNAFTKVMNVVFNELSSPISFYARFLHVWGKIQTLSSSLFCERSTSMDCLSHFLTQTLLPKGTLVYDMMILYEIVSS